MKPLQYDLRCPAAQDNGITHATAAPSNLDAAITLRSAEIAAWEIAAPKPDLGAKARKKQWSTFQKDF